MSEEMERMLVEAIRTQRPVLINPTEAEIRHAAEELRVAGRLICTACRKPITEPEFITQRIQFGERLQALAHVHRECEAGFTADMETP